MISGSVRSSFEAGDWTLNEGTGDRKVVINQKFSTPFVAPPVVLISFSELDVPDGPLRARVYASDVGRYGFNANIETWADSRLYAVTASWFAYEP